VSDLPEIDKIVADALRKVRKIRHKNLVSDDAIEEILTKLPPIIGVCYYLGCLTVTRDDCRIHEENNGQYS
jgi:hypothetical protein